MEVMQKQQFLAKVLLLGLTCGPVLSFWWMSVLLVFDVCLVLLIPDGSEFTPE